ncbi:sensor histidine kinase [Lutimaribacter marinistellae]|uniref:histidine kinase n=1 Tax=Lutimaribacter marinistellae TaxID=1820329 RepID=A0ABV7TEV9_9RHOB
MKPVRLTTLRLEKSADIMRLREVGMAIATKLGFATFERTRTVTAMIEMGRNAIEHGQRGRATFTLAEVQGRTAVQFTVLDQGRGIPEDVLERKRGTGQGLGLGLRGAERISYSFDIESGSEGTRIEAVFRPSSMLPLTDSLVSEVTEVISTLDDADPTAALTEQNRELLEALAERDLLMQELHHRVGNNLTLIGALIRMTASQSDSAETKQALTELETRVSSLAKAHELMQQAAKEGTVPAGKLLEDVAQNTERAFNTSGRQVRITVNCPPLELDGRVAVDIGLIVGELITNAYKHAFKGRSNGDITVTLSEPDDGGLYLTVADDGVGLAADAERPERSNSLGWRLIRTLVFQHDGTLTVENENGMTVRIHLAPAE